MSKKSLSDVTRKVAEMNDHKMKTRLSKGEKGNRKRMATVAAVYSVEPCFRTPEQIMNSKEPETKQKFPGQGRRTNEGGLVLRGWLWLLHMKFLKKR